jgi:ribulose-bisphosphate carboxylase small chain
MAAVATSSLAAVASAPTVAASSSRKASQQQTVGAFTGLKAATPFSASSNEWALKTVGNGSRVSCMRVWNPIDNPKFETLSYLPPLTDEQILKEIDYLIDNGWIPTLEFSPTGSISKTNHGSPCYYDGRYWTMWKLPMFGCQDSYQVLREVQECKSAYPDCYCRVIGFDNKRQVQCVGFVVHKPEY